MQYAPVASEIRASCIFPVPQPTKLDRDPDSLTSRTRIDSPITTQQAVAVPRVLRVQRIPALRALSQT